MPTDAHPGNAQPASANASEMPKVYTPGAHEDRIRERWFSSGAFCADPGSVLRGEKPPYCILIPPPNVTAALHLGHALNNTLQDILARAHRMKGYETLWMPGTDHAGIATQTVVDRRLRESGEPGIAEYKKLEADGASGRERFIEIVQAWKNEYERRITDQFKAMGCSCDFDRQRFTMDPVCARAVREAFFRLFRDGLIYRGKRLVNWDPVSQTALADDEVENREIDGAFYYLRYPLVHPPENPGDPLDAREVSWSELAARGYPGAEDQPEDRNAWVTVATTRPETYLGDTAVAINPHDPRATALRGMMVQLPLVGRIIPIVEDSYVVMPVELGGDESDPKARMATGFLKVTPAHDPNDWEIGRRHNLPVINVMAPDASISPDHGWSDYDARSGSHVFVGKSREDARALVIKEFKARTVPNSSEPLLEKITPYRHSVGHSGRSHAPIEPYLSDQWYVKVTDDRLRGEAQRALRADQRTDASLVAWPESRPADTRAGKAPGGATSDASMTFHPARYARTYEQWHDNLRDWCISRQLWWGHRIPVWQCGVYDADPAFEKRLAEWQSAGRIAIRHPGAMTADDATGEQTQPLAGFICVLDDTDDEIIEAIEARGFTQDPDVLDTWFSSALWPLSTMGWPDPGRVPSPSPAPEAIDPEQPEAIKCVFVKRVGAFRDFIGVENERSGELIERLLHFRDHDPARALKYQLFHESEPDRPLVDPDEIQEATDLVCAVGVRRTDPFRTQRFGVMQIPSWLRSHGFRPVDTFTGLLDAFNPTSVLCTAREIITLWVSRMAMFNRYFLADGGASGPAPFADVFIHAMIQDGEGRKMSKSLGNGVDPLDIIASHGADAMRYTLCHMTTHTQDVRMPVERDEKTGKNTSPKFDLGRNFCNKLWNASRFTTSILTRPGGAEPRAETPAPGERSLPDRWMLSRLASTAGAIDRAMADYEFSVYATLVYDLLWRDFCDWYLEAIKPTIESDAAQRDALRATLDTILRLLHPIAPYVTEVIFEALSTIPPRPVEGLDLAPVAPGSLLCLAPWPRASDALRDPDAERDFDRVRALVSAVREVRSQHGVHPRRKITLHVPASLLDDLQKIGGADLVRSLAGVDSLGDQPPPAQHAEFMFEGLTLHASDLADAVDASAERERLSKRADELRRSIGALEGRLNNPGYADKAPARLVEQTRSQLQEQQAELESVEASIKGLG